MANKRSLAIATGVAAWFLCGVLVYLLGFVWKPAQIAGPIGPTLCCLAPLLAGGAAFALVLAVARRSTA
jgi:hypothetical protein